MKPSPGNNIGREKHILMLSAIAPVRGQSSAGSNIVSCQVPGGGIVGPIQLEDEITTFDYCGRSALRDAFETTWRKKELDRMHGLNWYDSSARYYDHVLGRFHQIDPLAEKYYAWSPYTYCHNNPVNAIAPDGRDGVLVVSEENHSIVVKANYYVETGRRPSKFCNEVSGYSTSEISRMQMYNEDLNKLEMKITEGDFAGYSVSFDLQFIAGGNMVETMNASSEDFYEGYHIGNTFARWDETFRGFSPRETATGERVEIGGLTSENKDIIMNIHHDTKMNRLHEIFHTFGFDDFKEGEKGYGIMNYPPYQPCQKDVNHLINNHFLPIIYE